MDKYFSFYGISRLVSLPFTIIKEPYFYSLQYQVLNRIINCKYKIFTWKISEDNKCIYCNNIDTLEHHLYTCIECEKLWELISEWIKTNLDTGFKLTICEIILEYQLIKTKQ